MELRLHLSLEIDFGRIYQIQSNKQAHFIFLKNRFNVGGARTATVGFAKYMYRRSGIKHDLT